MRSRRPDVPKTIADFAVIRETALGSEHVETIRAAEALAGLGGGRGL